MSYKTKQKDIILNVIRKQEHEFTIKDIYDEIKNKTGLTTIYRLVDKMVKNNELKKYIDENNITYYQYLEKCNEDNHFYLKCHDCGKIIHIDCDCIKSLSNHINERHQFKIDKEQIIINGLCNKCINKVKVDDANEKSK